VVPGGNLTYYARPGSIFYCSADSYPNSTYSWFLNGSSSTGIANNSNYTINTIGKYSLTCTAAVNTTICNSQTTTVNIVAVGEYYKKLCILMRKIDHFSYERIGIVSETTFHLLAYCLSHFVSLFAQSLFVNLSIAFI
jgi:hypothetical protein